MKTTLWWVILGCLAVTLGLGLAWQRLQMRPLQAELEVLRDQARETGRLQVQHAKLAAAQVPKAEVERLRSDRAAITRMRSEVESLRAKAEMKSRPEPAKTPERFGMGVDMPAAEWRNAGGATAAAALETVLWAAAGGEVEAFAKRIRFDAAARAAALELLQSLPPAERARHSSPEGLMAFLSIKDVPIGTATVTTWSGRPDTLQSASVTLAAPGEKLRRVSLVFVRDGEEWKLRATEAAVAKYAAALRGQAVAAGGGK
jgi:hypothetical protein